MYHLRVLLRHPPMACDTLVDQRFDRSSVSRPPSYFARISRTTGCRIEPAAARRSSAHSRSDMTYGGFTNDRFFNKSVTNKTISEPNIAPSDAITAAVSFSIFPMLIKNTPILPDILPIAPHKRLVPVPKVFLIRLATKPNTRPITIASKTTRPIGVILISASVGIVFTPFQFSTTMERQGKPLTAPVLILRSVQLPQPFRS